MNESKTQPVALITGASGAIGSELARLLAQQGMTTVLMGRDVKKLEALYDQILQDNGPEPAIIPLDFEKAHWQHFEEVATNISQEFSRLDVLVHCAAEFQGLQPLLEVDLNHFARSLHVNLNTPYFLTRALSDLLIQTPASKVLLIGDKHVQSPKAYWGAYSIAKAGMENLAGILAEELEHQDIAVKYLALNPADTPLRQRAFPAEGGQQAVRSANQAATEIVEFLG